VPGFCTSVAVGRWGCFFSGLSDHTHGCPRRSPRATTSATACPGTPCSSMSRPRWPRSSCMPS
jgi:hypothetical protein